MTDLVYLTLSAGKGGDGKVSFRREKFIPKGGPDGGDGGDGGSIYLIGRKGISTLSAFSGKTSFRAQSGEPGGGQRMFGQKGEDLEIEVPVGTKVWQLAEPLDKSQRGRLKHDDWRELDKSVVVEILEEGQRVMVCKGGKGGRGNDRFKSSIKTTPMDAEKGTSGEEMNVFLELQLLVDVGLVGFPNAGKSTLMSIVTKANPRVAAYPFTTLEPHLGVMKLGQDDDQRGVEVVLADIPGLIEGASAGKGLGYEFLRHIERCRVLMFLLSLDEIQLSETGDPVALSQLLTQQFAVLRKELQEYNQELSEYPYLVTISKADLYTQKERAEILRELCGKKEFAGKNILFFSAVTKDGMGELTRELGKFFT